MHSEGEGEVMLCLTVLCVLEIILQHLAIFRSDAVVDDLLRTLTRTLTTQVSHTLFGYQHLNGVLGMVEVGYHRHDRRDSSVLRRRSGGEDGDIRITSEITRTADTVHHLRTCDESRIQNSLGRVAVLADTAHAFGAVCGDTPVGSIADFSAFSFHAVKNLTTAEGGALTWREFDGIDSADIYKKLQLLSLHGQSKDALAKVQLGAWDYDIIGTWYKCNMTDIAAAVGLGQMDRYDAMLARRREIIGRYDAALKPLGVQVLDHYNARHRSSGHLYLTRIPGITVEQRNEIIRRMAERRIACNVHYKPLPMHTAYKALGFDIADYPNAYAHFANEITLPLHTRLTDEEVQYVIDNYVEILKEYL